MNELDKIKLYLRVVKKMLANFDIEGINIKYTGKDLLRTIRGEDIQVPLFSVSNPKNIPFSYNSLHDYMFGEMLKVEKFAGTELSHSILGKLFEFDDFYENDFHIPDLIEKRLKRCINNTDANIKYRKHDVIYTIYCEYKVDDNFEMYWNDSEEFRIEVTLLLKEVFVDNVGSGDFYTITDKKEMSELVYFITGESHEEFENPVWPCIKEHLTSYEAFLDTQWQYVNVSVIPK